jgi:hypothetical protein
VIKHMVPGVVAPPHFTPTTSFSRSCGCCANGIRTSLIYLLNSSLFFNTDLGRSSTIVV